MYQVLARKREQSREKVKEISWLESMVVYVSSIPVPSHPFHPHTISSCVSASFNAVFSTREAFFYFLHALLYKGRLLFREKSDERDFSFDQVMDTVLEFE